MSLTNILGSVADGVREFHSINMELAGDLRECLQDGHELVVGIPQMLCADDDTGWQPSSEVRKAAAATIATARRRFADAHLQHLERTARLRDRIVAFAERCLAIMEGTADEVPRHADAFDHIFGANLVVVPPERPNVAETPGLRQDDATEYAKAAAAYEKTIEARLERLVLLRQRLTDLDAEIERRERLFDDEDVPDSHRQNVAGVGLFRDDGSLIRLDELTAFGS